MRLLHGLSVGEAASPIEDFTELLREMTILNPCGVERGIVKIAVTKSLTVYDASYTVLARKHGLTLVAEGRKLAKASEGIEGSVSLDDTI